MWAGSQLPSPAIRIYGKEPTLLLGHPGGAAGAHGTAGLLGAARKRDRHGPSSPLVGDGGERSGAQPHGPAGTRRVRTLQAREDRIREAYDELAVEEPLEIRVGRHDDRAAAPRPVSVTMRTPGNDFELAVGFLFTEGVVRGREDLASVGYARAHVRGPSENVVDVILERGVPLDLARMERNFYTSSSCGVCGKATLEAVRLRGIPPPAAGRPRLPAGLLPRLPRRLREGQALFATTGGLHAAGRFDAEGRCLAVREDVGRHNAVDKLVGERVLAGRVPLEDEALVVSGRASFEIVQKAAVAGLAFVVAVGAPSSLAVDLATEFGMTLVGFTRDRGFNVYAGEDRVARPAQAERMA